MSTQSAYTKIIQDKKLLHKYAAYHYLADTPYIDWVFIILFVVLANIFINLSFFSLIPFNNLNFVHLLWPSFV
jgi:hypothetical protein